MKFKNIMKLSTKAPIVWQKLNGVLVVYKSTGEHVRQSMNTLRYHLCRDLNKLEVRPPIQHVWIEGQTNDPMTVAVGPSYADDPLLTGPRYQLKDIKMFTANYLGTDTSGVFVIGINKGVRKAMAIKEGNPTKFYKLKGTLGRATDNYFHTGKVMEKTTWKHVRREHIDKICASMQSSHQRKMFDVCGVPIQSQAAFELAVQGPIRPTDNRIPMVYSIKCVDFKPPEFTLEIVCLNDNELFLKSIVHEVGMQVRSTAACSQLQCFRFGIFGVEHALLKKHWDLETIARNMNECRNLLAENAFMEKQSDPILKEYSNIKRIESPPEEQMVTA